MVWRVRELGLQFPYRQNGGMCGKCWAPIDVSKGRATSAQGGGDNYPWREGRAPSDPSALLAMLAAFPAFKSDPAALEKLQTQHADYKQSLIKPKEPHGEVQQLYRTMEQKRAAMEAAAERATELQQALDKANADVALASEQFLESEIKHKSAVKRLAQQAEVSTQKEGYTSDGKRILFSFDESLFTDIMDFDGEAQQQLAQIEADIKAKVEEVAKLQQMVQEAAARAKEIRSSPNKRARLDEGGAAAVGPGANGAAEGAAEAAAAPPAPPPAAEAPTVDDAAVKEQVKAALAEARVKVESKASANLGVPRSAGPRGAAASGSRS